MTLLRPYSNWKGKLVFLAISLCVLGGYWLWKMLGVWG
jgi:hypothetical protein